MNIISRYNLKSSDSKIQKLEIQLSGSQNTLKGVKVPSVTSTAHCRMVQE